MGILPYDFIFIMVLVGLGFRVSGLGLGVRVKGSCFALNPTATGRKSLQDFQQCSAMVRLVFSKDAL